MGNITIQISIIVVHCPFTVVVSVQNYYVYQASVRNGGSRWFFPTMKLVRYNADLICYGLVVTTEILTNFRTQHAITPKHVLLSCNWIKNYLYICIFFSVLIYLFSNAHHLCTVVS